MRFLVLTCLLVCMIGTSLLAQGADTLRVGIIPYKSAQKVRETFVPVADYLAAKLGRPVSVELVPDEELAWRLSEGSIDLGVFKPFAYLRGKEDFPELEVFATHLVHGFDRYTGLILTKDNGEVNYLKDFKGRDFLFVKPGSTSGFYYPRGIFRENDLNIDSAFFNYEFSYSHEISLEKLQVGEVDGVAISTEDFGTINNMNLQGLRILERFEVPYHAYVLRPGLEQQTGAIVMQALLSAGRDMQGKALFDNPLGISGWSSVNDSYYNYLRRYLGLVRVKPQLVLEFDVKESALDYLNKKGDIVSLLEDNVINALVKSGRFASAGQKVDALHKLPLRLTLSRIGEEQFHYATYRDEKRIGEIDLRERDLLPYLHLAVLNDVLGNETIETRLLSTGDKWLITYGLNDGLSKEQYEFFALQQGVEQGLQVRELSNLSTSFEPIAGLAANQQIRVRYKALDIAREGLDILDEVTTQKFWYDDPVDKLRIIGSVLIALFTTGIGWYLNKRRKRRFKAMLNQINHLMKAFLEDRFKLDNDIHHMRDQMGRYMEKGQITENQFLILKTKLDDLELQIGKLGAADSADLAKNLDQELQQAVKKETDATQDDQREDRDRPGDQDTPR